MRRNSFLSQIFSSESLPKFKEINKFIQTFHKGVYFIEDTLILGKYLVVDQVIQSCVT